VAAPSPVSAEERRALAALGYVGGVEGAVEGPLPDPKTRIRSVADLKACVAQTQAGAHRAAVVACARAVEEHPASLDAWEHLGRSAQALGDRRRALAAFVRALDLAEGRAGHLAIASALMLIEARRPEAALVLLDHEIPRTPDARPLRLLAARTLVLLGRLGEAEGRAAELVGEYPEDADALYLRGAVRMGLERFEESEADLRGALDLAPGHTAALSDLALLLERRGKGAEALELWRRLLALRSGDPAARAGVERLGGGG
jgi:tetratricopeptide (TPR) repeat protein